MVSTPTRPKGGKPRGGKPRPGSTATRQPAAAGAKLRTIYRRFWSAMPRSRDAACRPAAGQAGVLAC